jgi:ABC-2 type transport system ATP-binding protein
MSTEHGQLAPSLAPQQAQQPHAGSPEAAAPGRIVAPPAPAIRVRNLWQRFGPSVILRDVSFEVAHGEIFGFIGPNGAGKTTTIRVLTTLSEPSAGRAEVDGHDCVADAERVRKLVGYMPDHAGIYERVTVREYLEFFADAYGVASASKGYAVVDAAIELTDLHKLSDRLVAAMSKGQKQRLQLARTLLHDPKVLILDEPASDLDPRARIEMRDLLVELRKLGKTIFLSSHILTELADVCTSVAILERGRLVVSGPIHDIGRRLQMARQAQASSPPVAGQVPPGYAQHPGHYAGGPTGFAGAQQPNAGGAALEQQAAAHTAAGQSAAQAAAAYTAPRAVRTVKLRCIPSESDPRATIATLPFAQITGDAGGVMVIVCDGDDRKVAELVRALVLAGHEVCGVEPERNELERIFLEVTRGDQQ